MYEYILLANNNPISYEICVILLAIFKTRKYGGACFAKTPPLTVWLPHPFHDVVLKPAAARTAHQTVNSNKVILRSLMSSIQSQVAIFVQH